MNTRLQRGEAFCLKLEGRMTSEHRQALEKTIIDAMRRYPRLASDLSAVTEIDMYGLHLLKLLQNVGEIVAMSPAVAEAARQLQPAARPRGPASGHREKTALRR